jgi:di/tricarboxylate transporter
LAAAGSGLAEACTVAPVLFALACASGAALAELAPIRENAAPIAMSSLPDFIGNPPEILVAHCARSSPQGG